MPLLERAERPFFYAVLVGALALRLVYLWEYRGNPFFAAPIVDARSFLEQAQRIAAGDLWGGDEPFWQPPLYIYLLAALCWLFPADYFVAIRLFHALLGTISCALVYFLARAAFDVGVARLAAAATALCGTAIYFEGELLAVPVEIALDLALLLLLLRAHTSQGRAPWLAAGVAAGLAALTRPNILLFVAAFVPWLARRLRAGQRPGWHRRWLGRSALLLAPMGLVILPVTLRNYALEKDIVFISANGGINFYIGNNPDYDETVAIHPGVEWEEMVMEPVRAGVRTQAARSAYFFAKSLAYIAAHPLDYALLLGKKAYLFWSGPERKRNLDVYYARQHSHLLAVLLWDYGLSFPFGLIGPLALLGLGLSWRRNADGISLLRLYALSYTLSVVLFFVAARYRMPVLPVLLIFAAAAAQWLYRRLRASGPRAVVKPVALLAALLLVLNLPAASPATADAQLQFDLGEIRLRQGDYTGAEAHLRRALALEPDYNYARHNLAVALFHQGRFAQSIAEGRRTLAQNPRRPDTHLLLGRAYMALGQIQAAQRYLRRAIDIDPQEHAAHYYYGRLLYKMGRYAAASAQFARALELEPRDAWTHYELGRALHHSGDMAGALAAYQRAWELGRLPAAANAIGAVHFVDRDLPAARHYFQQALELEPDNVEAQVNLGLLDIDSGQRRRGLERLRRILRQHPDSPVARRAMQRLAAAGEGER